MAVFLTSKYKILLQLHILYTHHNTVIDSNAKKNRCCSILWIHHLTLKGGSPVKTVHFNNWSSLDSLIIKQLWYSVIDGWASASSIRRWIIDSKLRKLPKSKYPWKRKPPGAKQLNVYFLPDIIFSWKYWNQHKPACCLWQLASNS